MIPNSKGSEAEMYEEFKRRLIEEMVVRRDIIVMNQTGRMIEPIFEVTSEDDKLYKRLLDEFDMIAIRNVERLIGDLCIKHGIDVELAGNTGYFDLIMTREKTKYCIELKSSPRALNANGIERFMMHAESIGNPVCLVLLIKDSEKSRKEVQRIELHGTRKKYHDNLRIMLFDDFMTEFFGEDELKIFKKAMVPYKNEMHNAIGYQITEIFNEHNLALLKAELEKELREFDYENQREERFSEVRSKYRNFWDINDNNFRNIKRRFIDRERYKLLLGEGDFASAFMTSEWLCKKYFSLADLDNTFIVAGYLKSIEQLLWDIIYLKGQGSQIKRKGNRETVILDENNLEIIDTTLGSLEEFLKEYADDSIFESSFGSNTSFIRNYLKKQLATWHTKNRNGYFHKDNLKNIESIETIRNATIFLHFLVIGSISLDDDDLIILGM